VNIIVAKLSKNYHIQLDNKLSKDHNDLEFIKDQIVEYEQDLNILINLSTTSDSYGHLHEQKRNLIVQLDHLKEKLTYLEFDDNKNAG
jgi:DNA repair photolyase